jgi:hypothetical protein
MNIAKIRETKGTPILYIMRILAGIEILYHCNGPSANMPYVKKRRNDGNLLIGLGASIFNAACSACQVVFIAFVTKFVFLYPSKREIGP